MTESPIERYLDDLFVELRRTSPRDARSLLSETESHLRDAAEEAERNGIDPIDAENDAIRRFGHARQIAAGDRNRGRIDVVRALVVSAWSLGALGAIAVGASGVVAGVMRLAGASNEFMAGGRSTAKLSPSDCARWLSGYPHAQSCRQAALDDWAWETVGYRIAFGVLGLLALGLFVFARR
nr:permease prefix domain 1-containing protein [Actinomycetota bacterium]